MPKKQSQGFKHFQGSTSNNLGNTSAASRNGAAESSNASVNERLSALRKIESPEAAQRKKLLAEHANQRSIPPALRGLLGVPDAAPPKPKIGVRSRERMRTPGPQAPRSWLYGPSTSSDLNSRTVVRRDARKASTRQPDQRQQILLRFARLLGRPEDVQGSGSPSLRHTALKSTASNWHLFDEEDYPSLHDLPISLRLDLLSYLARYGPAIDMAVFDALTGGSELVTFLDLGGLCNTPDFSIKKLVRLAQQEQAQPINSTPSDLLDSWEDAEPSLASLSLQQPSRFASLTQLSLSHPVQPSWKDLIAFSKHTPQVTHLSLAFWPRPTLTPNLTTTTIKSQRGPEINAGGTSLYSSLDEEYTEPITLLRQLSGNLLRLKWLDLEGCSEWVGSLAQTIVPLSSFEQTQSHADEASSPTAILTTNWKEVTYLNVSQGWFPALSSIVPIHKLGTVKLDEFTADLVEHLQALERQCENVPPEALNDRRRSLGIVVDSTPDAQSRRAAIWKQAQYLLCKQARSIHQLRRAAGCKPVQIDLGYKMPRSWKYMG